MNRPEFVRFHVNLDDCVFVESATSSPTSTPTPQQQQPSQASSMTHAVGGSQSQPPHMAPQPVKMEYYTSVMRNTVKGKHTCQMVVSVPASPRPRTKTFVINNNSSTVQHCFKKTNHLV